jgi:hypothetical protein
MSSTRNPGRVAGLWYLLIVLGGPLRLIYIPTKLFVHGNAAATASNIAAHEWLFRFGIVTDLFCAVIGIFLPWPSTAYSKEWTRTSPCWWSSSGA